MRYVPSERSLWFGLIVWVVVPGVVAFLLVLLLREPTRWWDWILAGAVPAALEGLLIWIWFGTGYAVTENELVIRSAFLTWRIPLAAIRRVRPTRSPLTSPALSMDRLEVRTNKGSAPLISPRNRSEFLALLRERCPQADIVA
ncbi:MAG: hypothetical protein A6D92_07215 [Symbiobacterium thermophilum]|uniref:Uncharacterized protein YyaB-like PH domain-containing protein n=1 Tax=Symbiobacterium thermophilum TaxID=2734 RepID=A0A1Y2T6I0_SYMTR|nr:MAG: hypothetical protein A6D92_07215 [Symbiobacterium thermophilum]